MKKIIYLFAILAFTAACSSQQSEESSDADASEAEAEESIFTYSGSFEMGDKANQELVKTLLESFKSNDMETMASVMADSMSFYFSDGAIFHMPKDSAVAFVKAYRDGLSSVEIEYLAGMAVNSTDRDHQWSLNWTMETHTGDSTYAAVYQESFLIEDGKIRSMRQFEQVPNEADGGGEMTYEEDGYVYSGTWTDGDPASIDIAVGLQEAIQNKDMEAMRGYFADSVTIIGQDGWYFNSTGDSLMVLASEWLSNVAEMEVSYNAAISANSHQGDNWVLMWFETDWTSNDGNRINHYVHDDYMIVDGKIRVIRGYKMGIADDSADSD